MLNFDHLSLELIAILPPRRPIPSHRIGHSAASSVRPSPDKAHGWRPSPPALPPLSSEIDTFLNAMGTLFLHKRPPSLPPSPQFSSIPSSEFRRLSGRERATGGRARAGPVGVSEGESLFVSEVDLPIDKSDRFNCCPDDLRFSAGLANGGGYCGPRLGNFGTTNFYNGVQYLIPRLQALQR